ncbi:GPP34-domain-containing protein [Rickenella mellea]|uniref:GPP34-domain-containing protein n=1 Tax=Rickenella mellea TaxID=50990 RepID=A0A4V3AZS0_9AGAM|nr:GPP34-domain-containing protein [Rickenella mellea]
MATSGLSRRRVGGSSTTATEDENGLGVGLTPTANLNGYGSAPHSPSASSANISGPSTISHAGSAFEGGSKVAFDPRDVEREAQEVRKGGRMPRLTIMEEVLLLGLKDRQGYLSFWNDNISYALRGCILLELALRRRIAVVKDPSRRRQPLPDRLVEVIDDSQTGETILDETLRMMKSQDNAKIGVNSWIDLLSGETWNISKIGFQLKQVRERLAKGLVDKGVLRTEKRNFLLFDMATHPVADTRTKETIVNRCVALLMSQTSAIPPQAIGKEGENCRVTRSVCLVCAAYAASVLDNAFSRLGYEEREAAFQRCDDILAEFAVWPFGSSSGVPSATTRRRESSARIGAGSSGLSGREAVLGLLQGVRGEMQNSGDGASDGEDLCFEVVAAVLEVLSKLDSLL